MLGGIARGKTSERVVGFVGIALVNNVLGVNIWGRAQERGSKGPVN